MDFLHCYNIVNKAVYKLKAELSRIVESAGQRYAGICYSIFICAKLWTCQVVCLLVVGFTAVYH